MKKEIYESFEKPRNLKSLSVKEEIPIDLNISDPVATSFLMADAPCIATFKGKLFVAFRDGRKSMNHCIAICSSFDRKDWKLEATLNWKKDGKATYVPILTVDEEKIYIAYRREDDHKRCNMGYSEDGSLWKTFNVAYAVNLDQPPALTYDARNKDVVLAISTEVGDTHLKFHFGASSDWEEHPGKFKGYGILHDFPPCLTYMNGTTFFAYVDATGSDVIKQNPHTFSIYKLNDLNLTDRTRFILESGHEKFLTTGRVCFAPWSKYLMFGCIIDTDLEFSNKDNLDRFGNNFTPVISLFFFIDAKVSTGSFEYFRRDIENQEYSTNDAIAITSFKNKLFLAFKNLEGKLSVGYLELN